MDDKDIIADLKQFIAATVSQQLALQTSGLREDIRQDMKEEVGRLDKKIVALDNKLTRKIDDLSEAVAEALDTSNEETDKQLKNHERRITRLEKRTA